MVAINERADGFTAEVRQRLPWGYPHLADADHAIARAFGVQRFPALIFLDAEHRVRAEIVGVPTESELMRGLRIAMSAG